MKLTLKIKRLNRNIELPKVIKKGEWIDLRAAKTVTLEAPQAGTLKTHKVNGENVSHRDVTFNPVAIGLGVAMRLPEGFEALILPRSGTFNNFGMILANSQGVIDNSYSGDGDEWKFQAIPLRDSVINEGERICQFRIQLSQKATMWQKLKWLFCSGIRIEEVVRLGGPDRGGFSTTGVK